MPNGTNAGFNAMSSTTANEDDILRYRAGSLNIVGNYGNDVLCVSTNIATYKYCWD